MKHSYFKLAESEAWKSNHRIKIGAVLVHNGRPINTAHNIVGKSHPRTKWFIHAEHNALLGIHRKDLTGSEMYVFRVNSFGRRGNCRPCDNCRLLMKEVGVKKVFYTNSEGQYEHETL